MSVSYVAYAATDVGCVRSNNEDAFQVDEASGLFLLADGMGGARAGERASHLAVRTVCDYLNQAENPRSTAALKAGFVSANNTVRTTAAGDPALRGMGTTLVAALDCETHLAIASVGDSRCYLFHRGELRQITDDQTWVNEVGRNLGFDEAQLRTHPHRHVLTMAIGVEMDLKVLEYTLQVSTGDQVLLSSDGLHGVVPAEKIAFALNSERSLSDKCHYLIDAARSAGGPDNITVVLLQKN